MATVLNAYLNFRDSTRAAMEFYQSVLGGELSIMTFGDGMPDAPAEESHLIMHAYLAAPGGMVLMASDVPPSMPFEGMGDAITLSISGEDAAELERYWAGLADGATITLPFGDALWGGKFGMLTDRFGVPWMVNVNAAPPAA